MDFIQPRARTFVDKNRCRVCHRADGYRRPEGAEASLGVIDVVLPEHPEPFESLRTLVTNKLRQRIQVACTNPSCKAVVGILTELILTRPSKAVVINIDRSRNNPERDITGLDENRDAAEIARRQALPFLKDDRKVTVSPPCSVIIDFIHSNSVYKLGESHNRVECGGRQKGVVQTRFGSPALGIHSFWTFHCTLLRQSRQRLRSQ